MYWLRQYRFGELAAILHDAKAQGNDLCGQQEVDHFLLICFHQSAYTGLTQGTDETFSRHEEYRCIYKFTFYKHSVTVNE